jgi:uracil-DNA glycosylase
MITKNIEESWQKELSPEFKKEYFKGLKSFLKEQRSGEAPVYPPKTDVFNALNSTPLKSVKAVIIGQDPYHGEGQAHGLCFSVKRGVKTPPSLKNIYKEMKTDLGLEPIEHGNLQSWADQGVLMMNSVLTVEKSSPASHRKQGWEKFTDRIIEILNEEKEHLVFILWGNDAKKKAVNIDREKHLVLESAHPSPFSFKKFLGCKHFSKTNAYLEEHGIKPINWELPD